MAIATGERPEPRPVLQTNVKVEKSIAHLTVDDATVLMHG
jgi:hypothetical protein